MILKNYYDAIPDEMIEAASIDGAEGIPEKWKAPLGDKIVTMCIDKTWAASGCLRPARSWPSA